MFGDHIERGDPQLLPEDEQADSFFTKALAAVSLVLAGDVSTQDAAGAVTDGADDNGIDALFLDQNQRALYVVLSRWDPNGKGSIPDSDAQKFLLGLRDLLDGRFDRFNSTIKQKQELVESALNDVRTRVVLVLAYSGVDDLSGDVASAFAELLKELNNPTPIVSMLVVRQSNLVAFLTQGVRENAVDLEVVLFEWARTDQPLQAVYGSIAAVDVARWWNDHYPRLLAPNIRLFLEQTPVSESLVRSLTEMSDRFWSFSNGLTAVCNTIEREPGAVGGTQSSVFRCRGFSIVSGALTVGAVAAAAATRPGAVANLRIPIRIICLAGTSGEIATELLKHSALETAAARAYPQRLIAPPKPFESADD